MVGPHRVDGKWEPGLWFSFVGRGGSVRGRTLKGYQVSQMWLCDTKFLPCGV